MKSNPKTLEVAIYAKPEFQSEELVAGEIELLMSILPELLLELESITEAVSSSKSGHASVFTSRGLT